MKMNNRMIILRITLLTCTAALAAGCARKNLKQPAAPSPVTVADAAAPAPAPEENGGEGSLREKAYLPAPGITAVRFDYDKAELGEDARAALRANAAALKKLPGVEILITGNCDERGTSGYNLALGQLRAAAVRDYYKFLGVKMASMATISYGEEAPLCGESSEECWARNRRAETLLKVK